MCCIDPAGTVATTIDTDWHVYGTALGSVWHLCWHASHNAMQQNVLCDDSNDDNNFKCHQRNATSFYNL